MRWRAALLGAWQARGAWTVAAILAAVLALRLSIMQRYSQLLDCANCLVPAALWSQAQLLLALVLADVAARRWLPRRGWLVRALVLACLLIDVLDYWVLDSFLLRLDWQQVLKFAREWGAGRSMALQALSGLAPWQQALAALAALALASGLLAYLRRPGGRAPLWLVLGCALALALVTLLQPPRSFHHAYVRNALLAFIDPPSLHRGYSPAWLARNGAHLRQAAAQCTPSSVPAPGRAAAPAPRQVLLIVVESLSSYQSQAFGGIHDWTPQLDQWALRGRAFSHFLANGKATEEGLFALLTGRPPLLQPGRGSVYESSAAAQRPSLPQRLGQAGWLTAFMTTGNLEFMHKGEWLARIGFDKAYGHDHPFYDGMQRYHFDAPWDDALYAHALAWMRKRQEGRYFLVLETVSTHQPYFDPVHQRPSIEGAFRYADAALGRFLQQLQQSGFLQRGLVVITGDHRAMVPTDAREWEHFGEDTMSAVPLLLLGRGVQPGWEHGYFSQQDLLPSLQRLLTGQAPCLHPGQGVWTRGAAAGAPAQCIFTNRAQYPDREFLRCQGPTHAIALDGDDSRYLGADGPPEWLDELNSQRAPP